MNKVLLLLAVWIACISCLKWRGYDDDGTPVARTFKILKAGEGNVVEWRAVQKDFANAKNDKLKKRSVDAIQFLFTTHSFPRYVIRHFQKDADSTETRAAAHGLRKLVEFEDTNDDGFDPENDTIVSTYYLWDKTWSKMKKEDSTVDGANVVTVCSHTTDNVVEVCIMFTDILAQLTMNGSKFTIDNNAIHHTLSVKNFPFKSNTSRLALKVHFHMKDRIRDFTDADAVDTNNEAAVDLSSESDDSVKIRPVASWSKTVDACGGSAPVHRERFFEVESTKDKDINFPNDKDEEISVTFKERITYFSFMTDCARPDIFWDPDMGIVDNSDDSLASFTVPSLLAVVILAIWSMF